VSTPTGPAPEAPVVVVGAGISGVACARALADAGLPVRLLDRGRRVGGRMAVRTLEDGHAVDLGASYFTVTSPEFRAVVDGWVARGLARRWTDTFALGTPDGLEGTSTGPVRHAAPGGLRSLVEDLATGLSPVHPYEVTDVGGGPTTGLLSVDGEPARAVVLAMPGPQALDLLPESFTDERAAADALWEPSLALVVRFATRCGPPLDGVFVNDSPVLTFIADDGRRRGDGAPVLVAHADPVFAAGHLDEPDSAGPVMLAELRAVLGITAAEPTYLSVKRWSLAKPAQGRDEPFHLGPALVGLCGDGWHGPSKIEAAYLSGLALGNELAARLG
jgi:renalase